MYLSQVRGSDFCSKLENDQENQLFLDFFNNHKNQIKFNVNSFDFFCSKWVNDQAYNKSTKILQHCAE